MSDGPYKSLDMSKAWRKFAKHADTQAYSVAEVREELPRALERDWCQGGLPKLSRKIADIMNDCQESLFGNDRMDRIEALRGDAAGQPLAGDLLDRAIQEVADGRSGQEALLRTVENLLKERAIRGVRQVEEHYYRTSTSPRAIDVRDRLEEAVESYDMRALAAGLTGIDKAGLPAALVKKSGLDDGVKL